MILKKEYFNLLKLLGLFVKTLPKTIATIEDGKQLIKASGSVSAKLQTCFGH